MQSVVVIGRVEDQYYAFFVGNNMNAKIVATLPAGTTQPVIDKVLHTANTLADQHGVMATDAMLRTQGLGEILSMDIPEKIYA